MPPTHREGWWGQVRAKTGGSALETEGARGRRAEAPSPGRAALASPPHQAPGHLLGVDAQPRKGTMEGNVTSQQ